MRMKIEYDQSFTACQGQAWKPPSGACVDDIVAEYVCILNKESVALICGRPSDRYH